MPITRKELIRRLLKLGFIGPESGGNHQFMIKGEKRLTIPNPHHSNEIEDGLLSRILKQAGISKSDFEKEK